VYAERQTARIGDGPEAAQLVPKSGERRAGRSVRVKRQWRTIAIVATVAAIALSVVAVAYGATRTSRDQDGDNACEALAGNAKALDAMRDIRAEHVEEMQAWNDTYGSDPTTAEAQSALQKLRAEHWNDMNELFKRFGVEPSAGAGPGRALRGSGGCGGTCGGAGTGSRCDAQASDRGTGMMSSGDGMMGGWSY
jgi:hypothetical protein